MTTPDTAGPSGHRWLAGCLGFAAAAWPHVLMAQGNDPAQETTLPGGELVVVAYAVLWAGLLGYIAYLGRRQGRLDDEIDELEGRIDDLLEEGFDESTSDE